MGFADDCRIFSLKVEGQSAEVVTQCVLEATRSIVEGSEITGAPGQPVGQYGPGYHPGLVGGTLKASWQAVMEAPGQWLIASGGAAADYNRPIEDGVGKYGPLTLRSTVGGFHSVALTVAGWPRIVETVALRVAGGA